MNIETEGAVRLRELYLEELHQRVDTAFTNRAKERYIPEIGFTQEQLNRRDTGIWAYNTPEGIIIHFSETSDNINEVTVANPHDYFELVKYSMEKVSTHGLISKKDMDSAVLAAVQHEHEHYSSILECSTIKVRFGVYFWEDKSRNMTGLWPFIKLTGEIPLDILRKLIDNPKTKSTTDQQALKDIDGFKLKRT